MGMNVMGPRALPVSNGAKAYYIGGEKDGNEI